MEYVPYPPTAREPGQFAVRYVAYLAGIPPSVIYPLGIDVSVQGNEHLLSCVTDVVRRLLDVCEEATNDSADLADDLRTLQHCDEVLNGVPTLVEGRLVTLYPDPRDNGWFDQGTFFNYHGYRQGAWHRLGHHLPRRLYG